MMPVQKVFAAAQEKTVDIIKHYTDYDALAEENERLRAELGEAREAMAENSALEEENNVLREELGIKQEHEELELLPAKITSAVSGLQIDKGSDDGAELYTAVITPDGILGFISISGKNWSTVTPVNSQKFSAGGINSRTRETGVLKGDGRKLYLTCLLPTSQTKAGDLIVTDSGALPGGLIVGTAARVYDEENGLSRTAEIEPAVDITTTVDVFIAAGDK